MSNVTLIFRLHLPFVLARHNPLAAGDMIDVGATRRACLQMAKRSVLPVNQAVLSIRRRLDAPFQITCLVSGVALEIFETHGPQVIESFAQLCEQDVIDWAVLPYHHGLSSHISPSLFADEIDRTRAKVKELFRADAVTFGDSDLRDHSGMAWPADKVAFEQIICAPDCQPESTPLSSEPGRWRKILINTQASDLVCSHFSNPRSPKWPITAPHFARQVARLAETTGEIALLWDYWVFGVRHGAESGIFDFLLNLPHQLRRNGIDNLGPTRESTDDVVAQDSVTDLAISADGPNDDFPPALEEAGSSLAAQARCRLYSLIDKVLGSKNAHLSRQWRRLQDSEYFAVMDQPSGDFSGCTAYTGGLNGYEAFLAFMGHCDAIERGLEG